MQIQYGDSDSTSIYTPLFIANKILELGLPLQKSDSVDCVLLMEFPDLLSFIGEISSEETQNLGINEVPDGGIWAYKKFPFDVRIFNESNGSDHNHADNGEIILCYQGVPIFIDYGRLTYCCGEKKNLLQGTFGSQCNLD